MIERASRPQVFIAEFRGQLVDQLAPLGWGRMWVMCRPTPRDAEPWAFDNGAFRDYTAGRAFNAPAYRTRLQRAHETPTRPELAVAPDIVAGGMASLAYSMQWLRELPRDWPWFLAVQDGMAVEAVAEVLDEFDGLFLGGTSRFKASAPIWARLAHTRGKRFHYGRAGTVRKMRAAYAAGAASLDSAFPLWTRPRWAAFVEAWRQLGQDGQGHPVSLMSYL